MPKSLEELKRMEDLRCARRKALIEHSQKRIVPLVAKTCEFYDVTPGDILADNRHPVVRLARNVIVFLGYTRYHIPATALCEILQRSQGRQLIKRVEKHFVKDPEFRAAVAAIELKLEDGEEDESNVRVRPSGPCLRSV